jgi:hypothetical protein
MFLSISWGLKRAELVILSTVWGLMWVELVRLSTSGDLGIKVGIVTALVNNLGINEQNGYSCQQFCEQILVPWFAELVILSTIWGLS